MRRRSAAVIHRVQTGVLHAEVDTDDLLVASALRFLLATNPPALTRVLGVVYRSIFRRLIGKAGLTDATSHTGTVRLIECVGSALNLNVHFHMLFLDGVYRTSGAHPPVFRQVAAPDTNDLQELVEQIAARVGHALERRGLIEGDIENAWLASDHEASPLDDLIGHSITYGRIAPGPAGQARRGEGTRMHLRVSRPRRRSALLAAVAASTLVPSGPTQGTSQGPVADGPYVGTLPCADCAGIRTTLTLYTLGKGGEPLVYRMTATYLGTPHGDRTEERLGPWARVGSGTSERLRIEPQDDATRQSFRRAGPDALVLLDREERRIEAAHDLSLRRDAAASAARLEPPRMLFRGTLSRDADRLLLESCGGGRTRRVQDVSPEVIITAAITDIGFDERGSVYLEAYGSLRDGELWIDRLNRAGIEMACPTDTIRFRAQGNEPGWSILSRLTGVTFARQDGAELSAPPLPLSWRWPGGRPDRAEAVLTTATESSALQAVLAPKICRDAMANAVFGFTATVRLTRPEPAAEFQGCAFLGSESLPGVR